MKSTSAASLYFVSSPMELFIMDDFGNCVRINAQTVFTLDEMLPN